MARALRTHMHEEIIHPRTNRPTTHSPSHPPTNNRWTHQQTHPPTKALPKYCCTMKNVLLKPIQLLYVTTQKSRTRMTWILTWHVSTSKYVYIVRLKTPFTFYLLILTGYDVYRHARRKHSPTYKSTDLPTYLHTHCPSTAVRLNT